MYSSVECNLMSCFRVILDDIYMELGDVQQVLWGILMDMVRERAFCRISLYKKFTDVRKSLGKSKSAWTCGQ